MNNGHGGYNGGYGGGYGPPHAPYPQPQPHPHPHPHPHQQDNTLKGTLATAAAFVVLAAIVIPLGMNSGDDGGGLAGPAPEMPEIELPEGLDTGTDPADSDDSDGAGGGGAPADPVSEAFAAVSSGDCLANYQTDNDGTWNAETPEPVDCAADDAYLKVVEVMDDYGFCDGFELNATTWTHSFTDEETWATTYTTLCVERQYRVGECLMSEQEGEGDDATMRTGLMTAINCSASQVPVPYNQIMQVSGVPAANGDWGGDVCRQGGSDYNTYWYQNLDGGDGDVLCMTVYGS
ncbi:LppU/SCO3897 family protein [Streptomyces xiamenensis]|uniref:LppU/SCO3897 family protein n=1 Tax=Streptomyces xiamenensis TaxID=408015 RepID=UPI003D74174E